MTSFLDFNKDPANDIDNKPQQYHNFGGKGVRVQVYWAADIWRDVSLWNNSWALLKGADEILRKYTLSLDMLPLQTEPAALAPAKDKASRKFDRSVGKQVARQKKAKGEVAKKQTETVKDNEFAEASKSPVKVYQASSTFGSVSFEYPKTYSAYVIDKGSSSTVDGYFHPNVVPYIDDTAVSFGLRFKVVSESYASVLKSFDTYIKGGKTKVSAFRAAKVQQTLGTRVDGQLTSRKQGSMIILPLRDKTIEIWTESNDYLADFNKYVVPSISFVP